ncbi:MAG: hypothetical protein ACR2PA_04315 [Hyphomicrobiaceae bacterium]
MTLPILAACSDAAELDETEARKAMIKDRGVGYSNVCAAAMINKSKKDACEQDKQAQEAAFRFELGECKPGAPEVVKALADAVNEPVTSTVRWSNDLNKKAKLRSGVVLFHQIDGKLQAKHIIAAI